MRIKKNLLVNLVVIVNAIAGFFIAKFYQQYVGGIWTGFSVALLLFNWLGQRQLVKAEKSLEKAVRDQIISNQYDSWSNNDEE